MTANDSANQSPMLLQEHACDLYDASVAARVEGAKSESETYWRQSVGAALISIAGSLADIAASLDERRQP